MLTGYTGTTVHTVPSKEGKGIYMNMKEYQEPKSIDDYRKRVSECMSEKDKRKLEINKERFFSFVNKNGPLFVGPSITFPEINNTHCWDWTGGTNNRHLPYEKRHGVFSNPTFAKCAYRESYFLHNGNLIEIDSRWFNVYRITKVDLETRKPLTSTSRIMTIADITEDKEFGVTRRAIDIAVKKTIQNGYVQNVPKRMKTKFHGYRVEQLPWEKLDHKTLTRQLIMHKCNRRICVNPSHLKLGTAAENNAHREAEGRSNNFGRKKHVKHRKATPEQKRKENRRRVMLHRDKKNIKKLLENQSLTPEGEGKDQS